jgi:hypothetical protein
VYTWPLAGTSCALPLEKSVGSTKSGLVPLLRYPLRAQWLCFSFHCSYLRSASLPCCWSLVKIYMFARARPLAFSAGESWSHFARSGSGRFQTSSQWGQRSTDKSLSLSSGSCVFVLDRQWRSMTWIAGSISRGLLSGWAGVVDVGASRDGCTAGEGGFGRDL